MPKNWVSSTNFKSNLNLFSLILAFGFGLFFCKLTPNEGLAFCMPVGSERVNLELINVYRPLINQLPVESSWVYLFANFEELGSIIQTCRGGHLLEPEEMYEFIQQLYPEQLQCLLDSLIGTLRSNNPEVTQQCILLSRELLEESTNCVNTLGEITRNIGLVRGIDISNRPLEEIFPALLRELPFSYEVERVYAIQILLKTEMLYARYARLFPFLYFV